MISALVYNNSNRNNSKGGSTGSSKGGSTGSSKGGSTGSTKGDSILTIVRNSKSNSKE